jgi:hypothetical protein
MRLVNQTKGTVLAENVFLANSFFKRIKGLLGKASFNKGEALSIKPCNSIHTFFMRFSIDILFLDKKSKVIQALSGVKPFKLTRIYLQAEHAVELPSGAIKDSLTNIGDTLVLMSNLA